MTQNDVMQLLIGKDVGSATPTTAVNGVITSYASLVDGEMAVVNAHHRVLSATSVLTDDIVAVSGIKLLCRVGNQLISSDMIKQNNIINVKGVVDAAAAQQVSYIGYNGTSGSITATNSKLYVVRIKLKEEDYTGIGQGTLYNSPYKSDASATQVEVACGLALALSNTLRRQAVQSIKPELIASVAHSATGTFAHTTTIVQGSKVVTVATNKQYNTNVELAVGDFIRIAGSTGAPAVTDPTYKVVSLDSTTTFSVDRPIESASGTYLTTSLNVTVLTAAKIAAGNLGIKLTGIAREFILPKYRNSVVSFEVGLDSTLSFGTTAVTYSTKASKGNGTYSQIAQLEWDLAGNDGNVYRGDFMHSFPTAVASSSKTYDQIAITYFADPNTGGIGGSPRRQKQLCLAFETGFSNNEAPDIVHDVLEAYTTMDCVIGV